MARAPRAINRATPTSRPARAAGAGPGSTAIPPCAARSSPASNMAGRPSRWPGAWPARPAGPSSPTNPSTASLTPRSAARRTMPGVTICRAAKFKRGRRGRKGGSSASFIAHRRPLVDRPALAADRQTPGHWEADLMLFRTYGQADSPRTPLPPAPRRPAPRTSLTAPLAPTVTLAPSSRHHQLQQTFFCDPHAGRKAASRTPSGASAAPCPARPTSRASRPPDSPSSCRPTTTRHASASATRPPPRCFGIICCTWNVNPPSRVRGNDRARVTG